MIVVYISHRLGEVQQVADRITVFRNGMMAGTRPAAVATEDEIVAHDARPADRAALPRERGHSVRDAVTLRVRGLRLGHRLRDIDLDVHEGEVLGVGGLQGQGQLELFLALFGSARPGAGSRSTGARAHRAARGRR